MLNNLLLLRAKLMSVSEETGGLKYLRDLENVRDVLVGNDAYHSFSTKSCGTVESCLLFRRACIKLSVQALVSCMVTTYLREGDELLETDIDKDLSAQARKLTA